MTKLCRKPWVRMGEGRVQMDNKSAEAQFFGREKIWKILLKIAPPVMLAQLIQALYNIVDSLFVGRYAESGLTALSIIYPIQLFMMALAIGTGVGINTAMAARFGVGKRAAAQEFAGIGTPLAGILWVLFAVLTWLLMPAASCVCSASGCFLRASGLRFSRRREI